MCKIPTVPMSEAAVRLRPDDGTFARLCFSVKSLRLHSHRQVLHKTCASDSHASLPSCSQNMKTREVGLRAEAGGRRGCSTPPQKQMGGGEGFFVTPRSPLWRAPLCCITAEVTQKIHCVTANVLPGAKRPRSGEEDSFSHQLSGSGSRIDIKLG